MGMQLNQEQILDIFERRLKEETYQAIGDIYYITRQAVCDIIHRKSYQHYVIDPNLVKKARDITSKPGRKPFTSARKANLAKILYEEDGHTQAEISTFMNISQASVSRLLKVAS